jgi:hypothetical protein
LYDPVGLAASIFTQTSASPSPAMRASRVTGVFPMAESPPGRSIRTSSVKRVYRDDTCEVSWFGRT